MTLLTYILLWLAGGLISAFVLLVVEYLSSDQTTMEIPIVPLMTLFLIGWVGFVIAICIVCKELFEENRGIRIKTRKGKRLDREQIKNPQNNKDLTS